MTDHVTRPKPQMEGMLKRAREAIAAQIIGVCSDGNSDVGRVTSDICEALSDAGCLATPISMTARDLVAMAIAVMQSPAEDPLQPIVDRWFGPDRVRIEP